MWLPKFVPGEATSAIVILLHIDQTILCSSTVSILLACCCCQWSHSFPNCYGGWLVPNLDLFLGKVICVVNSEFHPSANIPWRVNFTPITCRVTVWTLRGDIHPSQHPLISSYLKGEIHPSNVATHLGPSPSCHGNGIQGQSWNQKYSQERHTFVISQYSREKYAWEHSNLFCCMPNLKSDTPLLSSSPTWPAGDTLYHQLVQHSINSPHRCRPSKRLVITRCKLATHHKVI